MLHYIHTYIYIGKEQMSKGLCHNATGKETFQMGPRPYFINFTALQSY